VFFSEKFKWMVKKVNLFKEEVRLVKGFLLNLLLNLVEFIPLFLHIIF
jgi:uncharacterized membrane protein YqaE (UPF0057 family)